MLHRIDDHSSTLGALCTKECPLIRLETFDHDGVYFSECSYRNMIFIYYFEGDNLLFRLKNYVCAWFQGTDVEGQ